MRCRNLQSTYTKKWGAAHNVPLPVAVFEISHLYLLFNPLRGFVRHFVQKTGRLNFHRASGVHDSGILFHVNLCLVQGRNRDRVGRLIDCLFGYRDVGEDRLIRLG